MGCPMGAGTAGPPCSKQNLPPRKAPALGHLHVINLHQAGDEKTLSGQNVRPQESLPGAGLMASWQAEPQGRSTSRWQLATPSLPPINTSALCYSESKRPEIYFYNRALAFHGGIKRKRISKTTYACKNHNLYPFEQSGARDQVLCKRPRCALDLRAARMASSPARDGA